MSGSATVRPPRARATDEWPPARVTGVPGSRARLVSGLREACAIPVALFLVSRAALAVLMRSGPALLPGPKGAHNPSGLPAGDPLTALGGWAAPWFRFDAAWYAGIVEHGYRWGPLGRASTNFMPLFPGLARVVQPLAGGSAWAATWLVANVAFAVALGLLWTWGKQTLGREPAQALLLLLLAFPFSFFYSAPYAEAPFLALTLAAFLCAERERWHWAIAFAGLAAVTRPVGLAMVLGLATLALQRRGTRKAAASLLALLPLFGYVGFLTARFGQPLGFMTYHTAGWVPPRGGLLITVAEQFQTRLSPFDRVDATVSALFLLCVPLVWRRLGPAYAVYAGVAVVLPLLHGLAGMERYVTVAFPVFALWATIEPRWLRTGIFAVSALALPFAVIMYSAGYTIT